MRLAVVIPSRERPEECKEAVHNVIYTSGADVLVGLDRDDPSINEYKLSHNPRVGVWADCPGGRAEAVEAVIQTFPEYDAYMVMSDDARFTRNWWCKEVLAALPADGVGVVSVEGEDELKVSNWLAVGRGWINALGFFNPPGMKYFCQDTYIHMLAVAAGRIAYVRPKAVWHKTIYHTSAWARLAADAQEFVTRCARHFESDLGKVKGAMK